MDAEYVGELGFNEIAILVVDAESKASRERKSPRITLMDGFWPRRPPSAVRKATSAASQATMRRWRPSIAGICGERGTMEQRAERDYSFLSRT